MSRPTTDATATGRATTASAPRRDGRRRRRRAAPRGAAGGRMRRRRHAGREVEGLRRARPGACSAGMRPERLARRRRAAASRSCSVTLHGARPEDPRPRHQHHRRRRHAAGDGIDFADAAPASLLGVLGLYVGVGVLAVPRRRTSLAGVVQRTMFRLRADVEDKLNRLPLSYVDRQPRGDLLSRVTNDIDNVAQSLQQTLSQLLTSTLTIVGVLIMMFIDLAAAGAHRARSPIPLSLFIDASSITKRSKTRFIAQWRHTGTLNAQVEEAFTGHALVKVFGRQHDVEERFRDKNEELYEASFGAQFISGIIQPAMMFLGNLNYVAIAVIGGLRVSSGQMTHRRHPGVHPVLAPVHPAAHAARVDGQRAAVGHRLGRAGLRAARRRRSRAPTPTRRRSTTRARRAGSSSTTCSFSYDPEKPLIEDLSLVAEPGQTVAIVGPTGAGKTTLVNLHHALLRARRRRDHARRPRHRQDAPPRPARRTSAWCCRTRGCSAARSARTSPTATSTPPRSRSSRRPRPRTSTASCTRCPTATTPIIDDEGGTVSAGEKQLLTIARAFLADPTILILDEATSSVDTRTEVLIQQAMAALRSQPHQLRDRPPAVDDPRRRHHPGDGARAASSSRATTTSCSPPAAPTPASTTPSSRHRPPRSPDPSTQRPRKPRSTTWVAASRPAPGCTAAPNALSTATSTTASVSTSPKPRGRRNDAMLRRPQSRAGAEVARRVASWTVASTYTRSIAASFACVRL